MQFFLLATLAIWVADPAAAQCGVGWEFVSGKCMLCGTTLKSADAASTDCINREGKLASILRTVEENFAESCAITLSANANEGVYIGLQARGSTTTPIFTWHDGSTYKDPTTFVDAFTGGVPAFARNTDNCYSITALKTWAQAITGGTATTDCATPRYYACSKNAPTCPALAPPKHASVVYNATTTPHYSGTVSTYSCASGYELVEGVTTRTCLDTGSWSVGEPTCIEMGCPTLTAPINGHVEADDPKYNSVATYSCNTGYTLGIVSSTRICQANQTWTGNDLACNAVDCNALTSPTNGAVSTSATTYGSIASYTCSDGYDMEGSNTRSCLATGSWSGAAPVCESKDKTLAIALGASFGGLALLGIIAGVIYFMSRTSPAGLTPYNRPAPYRRRPGYPRPGPPRGPARPVARPGPGRPY